MNIKNVLFMTFLLLGMFLSANAQEKYWIEGFYERHGEGRYTLKDVHTNGIYLDGENSLTETLYGEKMTIKCNNLDATMVKFSFKMATTDCPTKWSKGFKFQYWNEDTNNWDDDIEACRNSDADYSQNDVVIMLVLDYSGSMSNNISSLQSSAIKFINDISNASNGNIHVGIIAFSGMELAKKQAFPITPLNKDNRYQFERFIRNSDKGQETALYYSMDKAIGMMEDYVASKRISEDKFNGAFMITFTDGLDNASINDEISVTMHRGRKNEYLSYLSGKLSGSSRKTILGQPIENFAIGFTGSEEFTSENIAFFRDVLQQTTPDESHFKLATQIREVEAFFDATAKNLTKRWENLNMYIGEAQHGKIRWVLGCEEVSRPEPKPEPPKQEEPKSNKTFIGLNFGGGISPIYHSVRESYGNNTNYDYDDRIYPRFSLGLDFAFRAGNKANIGFYLYGGFPDVGLGPLALINFNKVSLYIGAGSSINYKAGSFGGGLRLGFATKKHFYMFLDVNPVYFASHKEYTTTEEVWVDDGYSDPFDDDPYDDYDDPWYWKSYRTVTVHKEETTKGGTSVSLCFGVHF